MDDVTGVVASRGKLLLKAGKFIYKTKLITGMGTIYFALRIASENGYMKITVFTNVCTLTLSSSKLATVGCMGDIK